MKMLEKRLVVSVAAVGLLSAVGSGFADVSGFGNGTGYSLTGYIQDNSGNIIIASDAPTISGGTLNLTTAGPGEARAAFYNTPQNIGSFTASFTFQMDPTSSGPLGPSDGFAFVLQNDSRSVSAIGAGGTGLGYGVTPYNNQPPSGSPVLTAISPSAATEFFLRNGNGATNFETGGAIDPNTGNATGSVSLVSGDQISVLVSYNGSTLSEKVADLSNSSISPYLANYSVNLAGALGGNTAYVGFTGGTGGGYSTQTISNFSFVTPEPASLALLAIGGLALLVRRRIGIGPR